MSSEKKTAEVQMIVTAGMGVDLGGKFAWTCDPVGCCGRRRELTPQMARSASSQEKDFKWKVIVKGKGTRGTVCDLLSEEPVECVGGNVQPSVVMDQELRRQLMLKRETCGEQKDGWKREPQAWLRAPTAGWRVRGADLQAGTPRPLTCSLGNRVFNNITERLVVNSNLCF